MTNQRDGGTASVFHFMLIAAGCETVHDIPEDIVTKGLDDCTVCSSGGRVELIFHRQAATLHEAIGSAVVDLKNCGIDATLASVDEPEEVADVA